MGGSLSSDTGSGANMLCLSENPVYDDLKRTNCGPSTIYGAEYEVCPDPHHDMDIVCAVCRSELRFLCHTVLNVRASRIFHILHKRTRHNAKFHTRIEVVHHVLSACDIIHAYFRCFKFEKNWFTFAFSVKKNVSIPELNSPQLVLDLRIYMIANPFQHPFYLLGSRQCSLGANSR